VTSGGEGEKQKKGGKRSESSALGCLTNETRKDKGLDFEGRWGENAMLEPLTIRGKCRDGRDMPAGRILKLHREGDKPPETIGMTPVEIKASAKRVRTSD